MELDFNLHQKSFKAIDNSSGLSNSNTIFTYEQNGSLVFGKYQGGEIEFGNIVGKFILPNTVELLFQCKTISNELLSGNSRGKIKKTKNGKLGILIEWQWHVGSSGSGNSYHEQV